MNMVDRIFSYLCERGFPWFWWLLRIGVHIIAPFGARNRATIFIYHHVHRVGELYHSGSTDREQFSWQMRLVKKVFNPVTIAKISEIDEASELPARSVVVTFDDGYLDNYSEALPILKEYEIPATIYVAVDAIKSGHMWNEAITRQIQKIQSSTLDLSEFGLGIHSIQSFEDRGVAAIEIVEKMKPLRTGKQKEIIRYITDHYGEVDAPRQMLTTEQLRRLGSETSITLGCHTLTHPMLSQIGIMEAEKDICLSKKLLESYISQPVEHFAYPYGKYGEHFHAEHVNLVAKLGFKSAVTTDWGTVNRTSSRYLLRRFTPWDNSPLRFYLRLCSNLNRD